MKIISLVRRIIRYGYHRLKVDKIFATNDKPEAGQPIDSITQEQYYRWLSDRKDDDRVVDIIIPVYKGVIQTKQCIESVLMYPQRRPFEIIVIDDCSAEPEMASYLERLAADGKITLKRNEVNMGFVESVNIGMRLHEGRDVLLLNSDTVVANNWLDRLILAAYSDWRIATVTPFSNNATICSYPRFCEDNRLPEGYSVQQLDMLFKNFNKGKRVLIPTAVGFCTYIKRICLKDVGLFDADRFGRGYGEENDFCMRASKRGWHHVLAADTFVFHEGSVSFGDELKKKIADVMKTLEQLHPEYPIMIERHIRLDPACRYRKAIDLYRLSHTTKPVVLWVSHHRGGGTEKHIRELADIVHSKLTILVLRPEHNRFVSLTWENKGERLKLFFSMVNDVDAMLSFLRTMGVTRIHYHHFIDIPRLLCQLPEKLQIPYDVTLHDYFTICPRICLLNYRDEYCGEKDEESCIFCAQESGICISEWRTKYYRILKNAERVIVPSVDMYDRIKKYYPDIELIAAYHPDGERSSSFPEPHVARMQEIENLRIVVMGGLSRHKGADVLNEVAVLAAKQRLPLEFHLIGHAYRQFDEVALKKHLFVYGRYNAQQQRKFVKSIRPHIGWIPALWPETYSYVLSEMMESRLPVVATNLGAFSERLAGRSLSWILKWDSTALDWIEFFKQIRNNFITNAHRNHPTKIDLQTIRKDFYGKHYLSFLNITSISDSQERNLTTLLGQPEDPFDPEAYLKANPDVARAIASGIFVSPAQHWLEYGKAEGRRLCIENTSIPMGEGELV